MSTVCTKMNSYYENQYFYAQTELKCAYNFHNKILYRDIYTQGFTHFAEPLESFNRIKYKLCKNFA